VEKTHRAPPSRTQRAPTGVKTRIARSLRSHTLAIAFIAPHAALLSPRLTRFLRQRLSGIRSRHDHDHAYEHAAASIRLCCHAGIRSHYDYDHAGIRSHYEHDHNIAASIRLCRDHDHEYELSASIRLC
jgi:hypothetical protein